MSQPLPVEGSADAALGSSGACPHEDNGDPAARATAGDPTVDNRRKFIRGSSLLIASALPAAGLAAASSAPPAVPPCTTPRPSAPGLATELSGQHEIKLGLVGCGFRGTQVIGSLLANHPDDRRWHLTAVADAFPDRMQQALRGLKGRFPQHVSVDSQARCVGLSGYRQLLERDVDLVILATPPAFRPEHFEAAVEAGKHVYAEKPIAVDVEGVRRFQAANLRAIEQGLLVSFGWPRHQRAQFQATLEQLRHGAIGRIVTACALQSVRLAAPATAGKSQSVRDVQLRNWTRHHWASGGPWIEPQVHNLDTINYLLGGPPLAARPAAASMLNETAEMNDFRPCDQATGDWQGHQPVEFLYAGGVSLLSYCQLVDSARPAKRVLTVHGTEGHCDLIAGRVFDSSGRLKWRAPQVAGGAGSGSGSGQFDGLFTALRDGGHLNQAAAAVEATLTAILGRLCNSQGQRVEWHEVA